MMRDTFLRYVLLLALGVFLATGGHAQQPHPAPPAAKKAGAQGASPVVTEAPPAVQLTLEPKAIDLLQAASSPPSHPQPQPSSLNSVYQTCTSPTSNRAR
jgi:hypothetical protein